MKTIEDLEKSYEVFHEVESNIESYVEFYSNIHRVIRDMEKACDIIILQIEESYRWKKPNKLRTLLPKFFVKEADDFYDFDSSILLEVSELLVHNLENFVRIRNLANEDNYLELAKLTDFLLLNYQSDISCLNNKKESSVGNTMFDTDYETSIELLDGFVEKQLGPYEEKTKQIIKNI